MQQIPKFKAGIGECNLNPLRICHFPCPGEQIVLCSDGVRVVVVHISICRMTGFIFLRRCPRFSIFPRAILQPSLDKGDRTITANQIALLHLGILADGKIVKGEQIGSRCLLVFFGKPNLISPQYIQVKKIGVV